MKKYETYKDFLNDEMFIKWRLIEDEQLQLYWNEFINNNPNCREIFFQAIEKFQNVKLNNVHISDTEKIKLKNRILSSVNRKVNDRRRFIMRMSVAASIIILLGISAIFMYWKYDMMEGNHNDNFTLAVGRILDSEDICFISGDKKKKFNDNVIISINDEEELIVQGKNKNEKIKIKNNRLNKLVVPYGKQSKITLQDGTILNINSGTVVEFPTQFDNDKREIYVSGEIYADVAKDNKRPFIVHTKDFNVRVYGTAFDVLSYNDESSSCVLVRGKVGIQKDEYGEVIMKENEKVSFNSGRFSKEAVDASKYISWKNKYLEFYNTSISDVLLKIGRYYNVSFSFDDINSLKQKYCSGKIYLSEDIDNVMETISLLSSGEYIKNEKEIYIKINKN